MIPRELLATATVSGGAPLRLVRHDRDFIIMLERNELMSSRMSGSEKALGTMTCDRLRDRAHARLLVGGYGMGFTLRAILANTGPGAHVVVAELVPEILDWARGPMAAMTQGCLDDPRVDVRIGDVADAIQEGSGAFDAILLDVDNGPHGVTRQANDHLYSGAGLARIRQALRRHGVLAVWSAGDDASFERALKAAGFGVEAVKVRARENGKGPIHTLWFAKAP